MNLTCNVHTHTSFCDGSNTAEEMVKGAISCGCTVLGFSGHSYLEYKNDWCMTEASQAEYIKEVLRLKEKYADKIEIMLGIEQDYAAGRPRNAFEYVIGSVHSVVKNGVRYEVDASAEEFKTCLNEAYSGDAMALARDYYALVADVADRTNCDIIGHFDLITKFNEKNPFFDTSKSDYRKIALEALDALIEKDKIFEINTGAVSRGWRSKPYPDEFLLRRLAERRANVIITSDAHSCDTVLYFFDEAVEYARACGVGELCVYKNKKIEKIKIR